MTLNFRKLSLVLTALAAFALPLAMSSVVADDYEWDPTSGYHEEEWYDPSDWFSDDDNVSYENDYYGSYYDGDYDYDDTWYGDNYYTSEWYDDEPDFDDWYDDDEWYEDDDDASYGVEAYDEVGGE